MTVISTDTDKEARSLTVVAEFAAPPAAVWQLWADPRLLERWWGPPTWPATFREYDFSAGGAAKYHMTGPEGERANGWWQLTTIEEPRHIEFEDGFADQDGNPDPNLPTSTIRVGFEAAGGGTRMTIVTSFRTADQMEQVLAMGMAEGMTLAMGQMDALLG